MKIRPAISPKRLAWGALGAVALFISGCAQSPYLDNYAYFPQPAVARVVRRAAPNQSPLTTTASIVGVQNADPTHHVPFAVVVRLQIDNDGPSQASFDPGTLVLTTGTLMPFPRPQLDPPTEFSIAPGQRQIVAAAFPLPPGASPGQIDMSNLRLRWDVRIDQYSVRQTALFQRGPAGYNNAGPYNADVAY